MPFFCIRIFVRRPSQITEIISTRMIVYIQLIRPVNLILTVFTIFLIGWNIAGDMGNAVWMLILAAISAGLIGAGANAHNDACDVEIDRINRPDRPVPSGRLSPQQAKRFGYGLMVGGIAANLLLPFACLIIAVATVLVLYLYNVYLKRTPFWGNLTVSLVTAAALIYTGAAVQNLSPVLLPALFAFCIHLAREVVKDMEDIEGDRQRGAKTFPVCYGLKKSTVLYTVIILMLIGITGWAGISGRYQPAFLWIVAGGIYPFLLLSLFMIWSKPEKTTYHRLSQWLKIGMAIGLIAILIGEKSLY